MKHVRNVTTEPAEIPADGVTPPDPDALSSGAGGTEEQEALLMNTDTVELAQEAPADLHMPMPWDIIPPEFLAGGVGLVLLAGAAAAAVQRNLPASSRRRPVMRLRWRAALRMHPGPGWAGDWERWRSLGLPATRKVASAARPSLSWWDLHRPGGWPAYATKLGTGWGWVFPRRAFVDLETVVLTIAGPRRGKSAAAIDSILDCDGRAVLATSIRDDLLAATIGPRSEVGRVDILNPEGLGDYASTIGVDLIAGCASPHTAVRRAGRMVEAETGSGLADKQFWDDQTSMVLSAYLHAAALAGYGMEDVYEWCNGTDDTPLRILREAKHANPAARGNVESFLQHMPDRTKGSLVATLRGALKFMENPEVRRALTTGNQLDIREFLSGPNTLYLVSNGADSSTQPLFAAFVQEIAYEGRRIAAEQKAQAEAEEAATGRSANISKRLDPPARFELDEIANTAPIPVDRWVTWMGGSGIQVRIYAQNWSQLKRRYGDNAEALWGCAGAILVYGGATEPELLDRLHSLTGRIEVRGPDSITYDQHGNKQREKTTREVDLITAADMRLPRHTAILLTADAQPMIVRTPNGYKRPEVKSWRKRGRPAGFLAPVRIEDPRPDTGLREQIERAKAGEQHTPVEPVPAEAPAAEEHAPAQAPPLPDEIAERRRMRQEALIEQARQRRLEQQAEKEATGGTPPPATGPAAPPADDAEEGEEGEWSGPAPRLSAPAPAAEAPPSTAAGTGLPAPPPAQDAPGDGGRPSAPADPPAGMPRLHPAPWLAPEQGGPRRRLPELDDEPTGEPMPWDEPWGQVDDLPPLDDDEEKK